MYIVYVCQAVGCIQARSCSHCCSGKAMRITYCECVCVCSLRYPACNAPAQYCHLWPVRLYNCFTHYLIKGTIFEKKKKVIETKMCVLILFIILV